MYVYVHQLSFNHLPYISKKIRATPEFIFKNTRDLIQEYPHIQFLFVKGRKESVRIMKKIFFSGCLYRKMDLDWDVSIFLLLGFGMMAGGILGFVDNNYVKKSDLKTNNENMV